MILFKKKWKIHMAEIKQERGRLKAYEDRKEIGVGDSNNEGRRLEERKKLSLLYRPLLGVCF